MKNPCIDCNACCEHEREGECQGPLERYIACLQSYVGCAECPAKDKRIADLETDAKGYAIQHKDFLDRAKLAEAKLALVQKRWAAWQKVRVMGICIGERMRLPGAAPDAIIDALDEACQG